MNRQRQQRDVGHAHGRALAPDLLARGGMSQCAVLLVLATIGRAANADCILHNNSDHDVHLGAWRLEVGKAKSVAPHDTFEDNGQKLEIECDTPGSHVKLVGTTGALTLERLPTWFVAFPTYRSVHITARKPGAIVAVDGAPVKLAKGQASYPIDVRAKLLASDLARLRADNGAWRVLVDIEARAGTERAALAVAVDLDDAAPGLFAELEHSRSKPVAWAAAPDPSGPAIVFTCVRPASHLDMVPLDAGLPPGTTAGRVLAVPEFEVVRSPRSLTAVSLVATCQVASVAIEKCAPSNDPYTKSTDRVERRRVDGKITLVEARTGHVVATTTLRGDEPPPCRDTATDPINGNPPSALAITDWLDHQP